MRSLKAEEAKKEADSVPGVTPGAWLQPEAGI